ARVPIVATDLPALREILRPGDNAFMATPGDPDAFADALCDALLDRPRAETFAQRARVDVERHTWLRRAEDVLHAFRRPKGGWCRGRCIRRAPSRVASLRPRRHRRSPLPDRRGSSHGPAAAGPS